MTDITIDHYVLILLSLPNVTCNCNLSYIYTQCPFCVSAAILGMYTLMSNKQYYDALGCTGKIANTEGINSMYSSNNTQE